MPGEIRERLGALSRGELVGVVLLVVVLLSGAALWYVRSLPRPVQVRAEPAAAPSASPSVELVLVDVTGWVRRPGVYEFGSGDRVIDAIEAAGGARRGAALESLNLAALLADGIQILVPRANAGGAPVTAPSAGSTSPGGTAVSPVGALVNVNTATATELESLPGVGEVIAQRIIDHRTANGPFGSVDELLDVSGIGEVTLEAMRELVTV